MYEGVEGFIDPGKIISPTSPTPLQERLGAQQQDSTPLWEEDTLQSDLKLSAAAKHERTIQAEQGLLGVSLFLVIMATWTACVLSLLVRDSFEPLTCNVFTSMHSHAVLWDWTTLMNNLMTVDCLNSTGKILRSPYSYPLSLFPISPMPI